MGIDNSDFLVYDIEGNALYNDITKAHCMWLEDPLTGAMEGFRPHEMCDGVQILLRTPIIVGHNIIDFDCPALEKLFDVKFNNFKLDTLVLSRLLDPDRYGGHSLKAWGKRLGYLKGDYGETEDNSIDVWEDFNEPMYKYCKKDVQLTTKVLYKLWEDAGFPDFPTFKDKVCK